jgi:hypothetical protein
MGAVYLMLWLESETMFGEPLEKIVEGVVFNIARLSFIPLEVSRQPGMTPDPLTIELV